MCHGHGVGGLCGWSAAEGSEDSRDSSCKPEAGRLIVTSHRLAVSVALAGVVAGCAVNRPHVKSLRDREAREIQFDVPILTTVKALNAIKSHCGPTSDHRVRHEEFQVYEVVGRIIRVKRERDHDIHVVLQDPEDPRQHLVAESADPDFRANTASPYRAKLAAARRMFEELQRQLGAQELKDVRGATVRVTGVGFFDMNHLQVGRSRSCIELHPILAIERVSEDSGLSRDLAMAANRVRASWTPVAAIQTWLFRSPRQVGPGRRAV
jgi:hypothetical protein